MRRSRILVIVALKRGAAVGVRIVLTPMAAGTLSLTASVTGDGTDPNSANNTATAATLVQ